MARYFWGPILGWFTGLALCVIITSVALKIGWKNPYEILLWGYATIGSISVFAWTQFSMRRKEDKMELDNILAKKADVKDIENINCKIDLIHQTLDHISNNQEEQHATIDNIYNLLLKRQK
jgi:hypothetical protein